jgi:hypothetical protein
MLRWLGWTTPQTFTPNVNGNLESPAPEAQLPPYWRPAIYNDQPFWGIGYPRGIGGSATGLAVIGDRIEGGGKSVTCLDSGTIQATGDVECVGGGFTGTSLSLDQSVVVGVPPAGISLLYADNTDRLKVASQAQPTKTIAYSEDVRDSITAPDGNAQMVCGDGGANVIWNQTAGIAVFSSSTVGGTTVIGCPNGTAYVSTNDTGDLEIKSDYGIKLQGIDWKMNGVNYPPGDGLAGQVWTTNGANVVSWQTLPPIPATLGMLVNFGGRLNNYTKKMLYNGGRGDTTGNGTNTSGNIYIAPVSSSIDLVTFDTQSGNATTVMGLYLNGNVTPAVTFQLTGLRGIRSGLNFSLVGGDVLAVGVVSGTLTNDCSIVLYLQ